MHRPGSGDRQAVMVIRNAKTYTGDPRHPAASAMSVSDGRITVVGGDVLHQFKPLAVRWERRPDLHDAFVSISWSLIC